MDEREWLTDRFEEHRTRLRAVAYRMLGSLSEADDTVQEAWLRLDRADTSEVENLGGWLTTVVARLCLDMLRARTSRREEPVGAHLPDPIASPQDGIDPEQEALLAEGIGLALLVVLDTLTPAERVAFDAFLAASRGGDFDALLAVLDPAVVVRADRAAVLAGADREVRGAPAVADTFS